MSNHGEACNQVTKRATYGLHMGFIGYLVPGNYLVLGIPSGTRHCQCKVAESLATALIGLNNAR